jgi:ribosomal protein S18 acetylase RimI-like enzyme
MAELRMRPMASAEYDGFRAKLIREYGAEHVQAGHWTEAEAPARAAEEIDRLLPQAAATPGMLLLVGETDAGEFAGHVWVALRHGDEADQSAWIYDIEVRPEHRGHGYGRLLLAAAERETAARGVGVIGLNVFGRNHVARGLYESSGYEVSTVQMRKVLLGGD